MKTLQYIFAHFCRVLAVECCHVSEERCYIGPTVKMKMLGGDLFLVSSMEACCPENCHYLGKYRKYYSTYNFHFYIKLPHRQCYNQCLILTKTQCFKIVASLKCALLHLYTILRCMAKLRTCFATVSGTFPNK